MQNTIHGEITMKKSIVIIIAVILAATACVGAFFLLSPSGECGDGVEWKYNPISKALTVSGKGEMTNYDDMGFDPPWFEKYRRSVRTVVIKSGVTSVGDFAFDGMGIEKVSIPEGVTYIGKSAFSFSELAEIELPGSLIAIGEGAFIGSALTQLTVPENVVSIGPWAFRHCEELLKVEIKGSISVLEAETFALCEALTEISLPCSLTLIDEGALDGCSLIDEVIFEGTREEWLKISIADGNDLSQTEIICNG